MIAGLAERFWRWRARLVADPGFQRRAARTPGLSAISRARSNELFALNSGFVRSQILFACVELSLFERLRAGALSEGALAEALGLSPAAAQRLLRAAGAIGALRPAGAGAWRLSDLGAVVAANEGVRAMIRHHAMLYRDLADPVALLRDPAAETETARFWAYARGGSVDAPTAEAYSRLMTASQDFVFEEALRGYPFGRHRAVLDIGGGEGRFLRALREARPALRLGLFDLPPVAERARAALGESASVHGGDFFADSIPAGYDCVTLLRVLCDHDDAAALALLRNIRAALEPGATLLIAEAMDGESAGARLAAAYFGFYFLAMRSGQCRAPAEIGALLRAAGFARWRVRRSANPLFAALVVATA